jgi:FtsK/SpoIIIE family
MWLLTERATRPGRRFVLRPMWRIPTWLAVTWWTARIMLALARLALRHWRALLTLTALAIASTNLNRTTATVGLATLAIGLVIWRLAHRASFHRCLWWPVLGWWRRLRYRRIWPDAVTTAGLAVWSTHRGVIIPALTSVRTTGTVDRLTVTMVTGQLADDYAAVGARLAEALSAHSFRITRGHRYGQVAITLMRTDPLTAVLGPMAIPAVPDFTALPIGIAEDGRSYRLRLAGTQVLVAGATGAGKSSVVWSILRALAGGIASGLVQVWAVDPKGGMELAAGANLFTRFAYTDPAGIADLLDQALTLARTRAARLRGTTRLLSPSLADPLVVVLVDELAALTAYLTDRTTRERIKTSLGLLLTQGRAVGVHVIAALQDARKEVLPFRNLFPTRIGLRVAEASEVDLVLGDGARDRGALCDRIPHTQPGIGYVVLDGDPTPARVRFSYLTDTDISQLARQYHRPEVEQSRRPA